MKHQPENSPYYLHRLALSPLLPDADSESLIKSCEQISEIGEDTFQVFLDEQGLTPMWAEAIYKAKIDLPISTQFSDSLRQKRLVSTANYLSQSHAMKKAKDTLDATSIPHVVFKGCHIREQIYKDPAIRPASDMDMLASKSDIVAVIRALVNAGYEFAPHAENISHEASLWNGMITIDLHWDIMRPGRTRIDMTDTLLETRKDYSSHWGFSYEASLLLMLVHPVFTKYATAPQSSLMRIVDLAYWIKKEKLDWDTIHKWLAQAGVKTAAWIMLDWLKLLTDIETAQSFKNEIRPGALRARYLHYWLKHNLSTRFNEKTMVIQAGFTLPAHDKLTDAVRAMRSLIHAKRESAVETEKLQTSVAEKNSIKIK